MRPHGSEGEVRLLTGFIAVCHTVPGSNVRNGLWLRNLQPRHIFSPVVREHSA